MHTKIKAEVTGWAGINEKQDGRRAKTCKYQTGWVNKSI
jgi:hypothetical protein